MKDVSRRTFLAVTPICLVDYLQGTLLNLCCRLLREICCHVDDKLVAYVVVCMYVCTRYVTLNVVVRPRVGMQTCSVLMAMDIH